MLSRILFACVLAVGLSACTSMQYLAISAADPLQLRTMQSKDGQPLKYYALNPSPTPDALVLFLPASGCASVKYYLQGYFLGLDPRIMVIARQKFGVEADDLGILCAAEFHQENLFQRWVADQGELIESVLNDPQLTPKRIALFGVSESGVVAIRLAAKYPQVSNVILVGAGALPQRQELRLLAEHGVWDINKIDKGYESVASYPQASDRRFLGWPHRYWTSVLDVDPRPWLPGIEARWLVAFGEQDKSVPLESLRELERSLRKLRKPSEIIVYPGIGHSLPATERADFMRRINNELLNGEER